MSKRGRNREAGHEPDGERDDAKPGGADSESGGPPPAPAAPVRSLWLWIAVGLWAAWLTGMICLSRNEWFRPRAPEGEGAGAGNVVR